MLFAASARAAATSSFDIRSAAGKDLTFALIGYDWLSRNHKVGRPGKVQVDVVVATQAEKSALKKGHLRRASIHIVALPQKINQTFRFNGTTITHVLFVQGASGPTAVVNLSYRQRVR